MRVVRHDPLGERLARALHGAWRSHSLPLDLTEDELESTRPLLHKAAVGTLLWWRLRKSPLAQSALVVELHEIAAGVALNHIQYEREVAQIFACLGEASVDAILVKGWAMARHYPDPSLRPLGDIDLIVRPDQEAHAARLLRDLNLTRFVDLEHEDIGRLSDGGWDDLFAHSQRASLNGAPIRVLSPEDHLALLCMHCLHHGCSRAIWLCDIAVALEARPPHFDWDRCIGTGSRSSAVLAGLRLTHALLGADISGTPATGKEAPRWLVAATLKAWEAPEFREYITRELVLDAVRRPWKLPAALFIRWPGPIEASLRVGAPFNDFPRFPFQLLSFVDLTARLLWRMPRLLRERGQPQAPTQ